MELSFLAFGFLTGLSFILAIGPQNLFVINQGLKKNYTTYLKKLIRHGHGMKNYSNMQNL